MKIMKPIILTGIFILLALTAKSQSDSSRWQQIIRYQDSTDAVWKKQMDSLSRAFYNTPKYFDIKLEINGKQRQIKKERFIVCIDEREIEIRPDSTGKYLMTLQVDSCQKIILKLVSRHIDIELNLKGRENEYIDIGATLTFGLIKDIYKQSRRGVRKPKDEDHELTKADELYNSILTNERTKEWILKNELHLINYVKVVPRVFGCGMAYQYVMYK